jgi:hypothetical protein
LDYKFKKRVLNLDLYGDKVELQFPTAGQLDKFLKEEQKILDGKSKKSVYENTKELFLKLGLKEELIGEMEMEHLNELIQIMLGQKKI